jgi:hypothetical protein
MRNLILTLSCVIAVLAGIFAASHADAKQQPAVTARFGFGPAKVHVDPSRPVARHEGERYLDDASGKIYLYEEIEYEDGSPEVRVSPVRWELEPQLAPLVPDPPSCSLSVISASLQGNTAAGTVHGEANVLCARVGAGNTPCDQVFATFYAYRLELGIWRPKTYVEYRDTPGCGETCPNLYVNATINAPGYYMFVFTGFNGRTNTTIWQPLTIYMQYPS